MSTVPNNRNPDWCTRIHEADEFLEDDFFHGRSFGFYDNGTPGVIQVGVSQMNGVFRDRDVLINTLEMTSSQDLRDLARDCLEAAEWMDENLGAEISLVTHGN